MNRCIPGLVSILCNLLFKNRISWQVHFNLLHNLGLFEFGSGVCSGNRLFRLQRVHKKKGIRSSATRKTVHVPII